MSSSPAIALLSDNPRWMLYDTDRNTAIGDTAVSKAEAAAIGENERQGRKGCTHLRVESTHMSGLTSSIPCSCFDGSPAYAYTEYCMSVPRRTNESTR